MSTLTAKGLYAQLYDLRVPDWPGELDFYRDFLTHTPESSQGILEIACGTGRVTLPLARAGYKLTGLDISTELLEIARKKSVGIANPSWFQADMRTFELKRKFGVIISPGHSFQFMNTSDEQAQCLDQVKRHLVPGGWLILHLDHQDVHWLADLLDQQEAPYSRAILANIPRPTKYFATAIIGPTNPPPRARPLTEFGRNCTAMDQSARSGAWNRPGCIAPSARKWNTFCSAAGLPSTASTVISSAIRLRIILKISSGWPETKFDR